MANIDSDFRFMASNDLYSELQKDSFVLDSFSETKVIDAILKLLQDTNSEVQNMTIKWYFYLISLAPLARKVRKVSYICQSICKLLDSGSDNSRDIAALGLKTFLSGLPQDSSDIPSVTSFLIPKLLLHLKKDVVDLDVIDILSDLMSQHGDTINSMNDATSLQTHILQLMLALINNPRQVVRKRAIQTISVFATIAFDSQFEQLSLTIIKDLETKASEKDYERLVSLLLCVGSLCKFSPERMSQQLNGLLTSTLDYIRYDNDELKEQCLHTLEAFAESLEVESSQLNAIIQIALEYIKYDPNYLDDGDDEMVSDDDGLSEEDETFSDDDDVSWKVRRASSKLLSTIIKKFRGELSSLYSLISPVLVKRFSEREEVVRTEVLQTFVDLVNAISQEDTPSSQPNAKRRKGFHGQQVEGDQDTAILLHGDIGTIITALSKQLNTKSVNTTLLGFVLLTKLVTVLQGGLESSFQHVLPAIQSSLTIEKSHFQGTNTSIKIQALEFLNVVLKYHEPESIWPYIPSITESVTESTMNKFYKVRTAAMEVINLIIVCLFPDNKQQSPDTTIIPKLFDCIWSCAEDEVEVTELAIKTMGVMVARVGDLLDPSVLNTILPYLKAQLGSETTRISSLSAITTILSSRKISGAEELIGPVRALMVLPHRPTVIESIGCLQRIVQTTQITPAEVIELEKDIHTVMSQHPDAHVLPLALDLLTNIFSKHQVDPQSTLVKVVDTVCAHHYALTGASASLVRLLDCLLVNPAAHSILLKRNDIPKSAWSLYAKCVARVCKIEPSTLNQLLKPDPLCLLTIGEAGLLLDVTQTIPSLVKQLESFYSTEDLKGPVTFCMGSCAIGSLEISNLVLQDSRELYQQSIQHMLSGLKPGDHRIEAVWTTLSKSQDGDSLARVALLNLESFLPRFQLLDLKLALHALRYILVHTEEAIDAYIHPLLMQGFSHEDYQIRASAIQVLLGYLKFPKPNMDGYVPFVLENCKFRKELVTVVQMGPFQHKIDNGLELRKTSMEVLKLLVTYGTTSIDQTVLEGLQDPQTEMKIVTMGVVIELSKVKNVDFLVDELKNIIATTTKETAVKQEVEANKGLVDAGKSCIKQLEKTTRWKELKDLV